jgi:hypothetical protein
MRKGVHLDCSGKLIKTLDIASICCDRPGQGRFTKLLAQIEIFSPYPIYIESVLNERLKLFFISKDYQIIPNSNPMCFINKL